MRLRVVLCETCGWVRDADCPHWPRKCSSSRDHKHKLKRDRPGFDVLPTQEDEASPPTVVKHVDGLWLGEDDSRWRPWTPGLLVRCRDCGLTGAL